jgi:hypothetical protein
MKEEKHIEDLALIRNLMEQSTRFMSLSGLSGILIGIYALIGATLAYYYLGIRGIYNQYETVKQSPFLIFFILIAGSVLILSLITAYLLSKNKSKKMKVGFWNKSAKLLVINLAIPLLIGGAFIGVLYFHNILGLIAPTTLVFYGLGLISAGNYTIKEIKILGLLEVALGILAGFNIGYGLYFWALGFGVLHILYGVIIYFKYDRE